MIDHSNRSARKERKPVAEMLRSMTIVFMGLIVIGAGVVVVIYG